MHEKKKKQNKKKQNKKQASSKGILKIRLGEK